MASSVCTYSFIPLRSGPSERSEMVSQILFGEAFEIIEYHESWIKVKNDLDDYTGWVDAKLVEPLRDTEIGRWRNSEKWVVPEPYVKIVCEPEKHHQYIPGGSCILFSGEGKNMFNIGNREYFLVSGTTGKIPEPGIRELAMAFINSPYLWGGKTFMGIDCSGFSQVVFKMAGKNIPRDASQQVNAGNTISFVKEAAAGDLAFFDNEQGAVTHVGICLGNGKIIHASGSVRIDKLDHIGIFNENRNTYTHKLRVIKRIL